MTTQALLEAAATLRRTREEFLIATVVDVRGSAYRRPGARMIVTRDRWVAGSVSGGCLEGDIVHKGFWRLSGGQPVVVTYDSTESDDAVGCNGAIDILFEHGHEGDLDPLSLIATARERQERVHLATVIRSSRPAVLVGSRLALVGDGGIRGELGELRLHASVCETLRALSTTTVASFEGVDVLFELITPPPRLFVLGGGHDAVPLVDHARAVGWDVFICLPHARPVARERFRNVAGFVFGDPGDIGCAVNASQRALAVVMNHHYEHDRASLRALHGSSAKYIGVLGPRHRTARMLAELGIVRDARLHAPVGLAIGAETPEEIALAIVAEMQAVLTQTDAARLREQPGPIHTPREVESHDDRWRRTGGR